MTTMFRRKIFTQRKSLVDILLPYAVGILMAWCIVCLVIYSYDGVK